jgi:hypothetical protein
MKLSLASILNPLSPLRPSDVQFHVHPKEFHSHLQNAAHRDHNLTSPLCIPNNAISQTINLKYRFCKLKLKQVLLTSFLCRIKGSNQCLEIVGSSYEKSYGRYWVFEKRWNAYHRLQLRNKYHLGYKSNLDKPILSSGHKSTGQRFHRAHKRLLDGVLSQ